MSALTQPFGVVSSPAPKKTAKFNAAYDELLQKIKNCLASDKDINVHEAEFKKYFRDFLTSQGLHLAAKNFDALLKEKSGKHFARSDGSVNWYHEFIPMLTVLSLVRKGKHHGGIDIDLLKDHGGIETLIITHLRHDSVEDFITKEELQEQQLQMLDEIDAERLPYDLDSAMDKIDHILTNNELLTQRKFWVEADDAIESEDADQLDFFENASDTGFPKKEGKWVKEDVTIYMERLLYSTTSNPIVFMMKQADVVHNLATLFAPKFDAERRKKRCNERENTYGGRFGAADMAKDKWKDFAPAIDTLDCAMGFELYSHFRFLENVDLAYPPEEKRPSDMPAGIFRYRKRALGINVPEELHMSHMFMKNMLSSVNIATEPDRFARFVDFMHKNMMPALNGYEDRFPYIFALEKQHFPDLSPVAM